MERQSDVSLEYASATVRGKVEAILAPIVRVGGIAFVTLS